MTEQTQKRQSKYQLTDKNSVFFKLFLAYDIFMVFIIVFNLFCLGMNLFLMSYLGEWFFQNIHLPELLSFYRTHLHPWVISTEAWFIVFLIAELLLDFGGLSQIDDGTVVVPGVLENPSDSVEGLPLHFKFFNFLRRKGSVILHNSGVLYY